MISKKMEPLVNNNSAIRAMFEEGLQMKKQFGAENVYDFSLGNPSVPAPAAVDQAIRAVLAEEDTLTVHGYMPNAGFEDVRAALAESLDRRFGMDYDAGDLIMVVGAASGLNILLKTILDPGDEVVTFAPYFVEYGAYVRNYDGVLRVVPPHAPDFQPDLEAFAGLLTEKTKAVIMNSPHNPTGVVYSEETLRRLAKILTDKEREIGHEIYLLSDEPYRELAYDGVNVPYVPWYYPDTIVCYSYSKSLSLPGERIGYVAVPKSVSDHDALIAAAVIANRVCGSVNAPSLMQRVLKRCLEEKTDVAVYDRNRRRLYEGLTQLGFECVRPEGAFYLWMKSPVEDEKAFVAAGKRYHILMVPGSSFACPGYVRLAYCVSYETIERSMPAFAELAKEYGL